jgi:hypothetical protein
MVSLRSDIGLGVGQSELFLATFGITLGVARRSPGLDGEQVFDLGVEGLVDTLLSPLFAEASACRVCFGVGGVVGLGLLER